VTAPAQPALRQQIAAALSEAGAFCGECGFEPGETGCPDCVRVRELYTEALLDVVQPLLDQQRAAGMREAAAMLRRYCPNHGPDDVDTAFMDCHCAGADEIDRDAAALSATT
jgi:hypothetical protein